MRSYFRVKYHHQYTTKPNRTHSNCKNFRPYQPNPALELTHVWPKTWLLRYLPPSCRPTVRAEINQVFALWPHLACVIRHRRFTCTVLPVLFCSDIERGLFDDDVGTAHASVSSSGHVSVDVTVDTCTAACVSDVLYFPFDRWHCSVELSADDHLQLTANHTHHLAR